MVSLSGEGQGWLPDQETGQLSVVGINTGGGMLKFEQVGFFFGSSEMMVLALCVSPYYIRSRFLLHSTLLELLQGT